MAGPNVGSPAPGDPTLRLDAPEPGISLVVGDAEGTVTVPETAEERSREPLVLHVIPSPDARGGQREARALADWLDEPGVRRHRVLSLVGGARRRRGPGGRGLRRRRGPQAALRAPPWASIPAWCCACAAPWPASIRLCSWPTAASPSSSSSPPASGAAPWRTTPSGPSLPKASARCAARCGGIWPAAPTSWWPRGPRCSRSAARSSGWPRPASCSCPTVAIPTSSAPIPTRHPGPNRW